MLTTIAAFIFSLAGFVSPMEVPGGAYDGHVLTYDYTKNPVDCVDVDKALTFTSGNHGWTYYCQVN